MSKMNECIICFDDNNIKEIILLSSFVRNCNCNYNTHLECMEKWVDTNPSCPLCKKLIIYNSNIDMSQGKETQSFSLLNEELCSSFVNYERDNVSMSQSNTPTQHNIYKRSIAPFVAVSVQVSLNELELSSCSPNRIETECSTHTSPLLHDPTHSIEMNISKRKYYITIILWIIVILLLFIVINLLV